MTMINYRKCIIDTKALLYNYLMDIVNTLTALLDPCNGEKGSNYLEKGCHREIPAADAGPRGGS